MQLRILVAIAVLVYAPGLIAADDQQGTIGEAAQALPLFDAHMHWKRPAWEPYPPE